uniref:Uncharacterized protein n=1 Tax=Zea mays TaxID=4577 RepID=A0A804Q4S0_MAIZE
MHWSGKGKPWDRLDAGKPCALDHTWKAYDLYIGENDSSSASASSGSGGGDQRREAPL